MSSERTAKVSSWSVLVCDHNKISCELFACWEIFRNLFLRTADFFSNYSFLERVSNILDPDQARHFVGPDLSPNCLQRLSADNTSKKFNTIE